MKKILIILLIIFKTNLFAQETIECQKDYCSIPSNIQLIKSSEFLNFSSFELISQDEDIGIDTTSYSRDFKFLLNTYNHQGINLDIKSNSTKDNKTGSNFFIFADSISSLNVDNDGFSGNIHLNSSDICAKEIKLGKYGFKVKNIYEERRENNPELPIKCDDIDLENIKTNTVHTCNENFISLETDNITAKREKIYRTCSGNASRKLCLSKKMELKCLWNGSKAVGDSGCCSSISNPSMGSITWSCDENLCSSTNSGWYRSFSKIQHEHQFKQEFSMDPQYLCSKFFYRGLADNSSADAIRDYGDFSGESAVRNFNPSFPSLSDKKIYRLEVAPGGYCNTSHSSGSQCTALENSLGSYIVSNDWISLGGTSSIKCTSSSASVTCTYRDTKLGTYNKMKNWRKVWFKVRGYYIDKWGNSAYHESYVSVEHQGYYGANDEFDSGDDDFWTGGQ